MQNAHTMTIGVSPAVTKGHGAQLVALLGRRSTASGIYDRGDGDLTSQLPLAKHLYYAGKGWTLVRITNLGGMATAAA